MELADDKASLAECIALANAIDISAGNSRDFPDQSTTMEVPTVAAVTPRRRTSLNQRPQSCFFCGRGRHPRAACPARNEVCRTCGKMGHWAKVCNSKTSAATRRLDVGNSSSTTGQDSEPEDTTTVASSVICATATRNKKTVYTTVIINGVAESEAMIDSGSTHSFITATLANKLQLPVTWNASTTRVANNSTISTRGHTTANIDMLQHQYHVQFTVVDTLVSDIIIGMDVLARHEMVELATGGDLPKISFTCATFPTLNIKPPNIFSSGLESHVRPIATRRRFVNPTDRLFIKSEIQRLLEGNIIEESNSPWRAQAFVVRDRKPRLVIDYSETINLFTQLDAFPFTSAETTLDKVAENTYFSRVDLASAYHQVPIKPKDRCYTAFEADGCLYQFTRLAFGLTNAVPTFQRIMETFVKDYKLERTYPYLDDITICGRTKEEHDKNLHRFREAARKVNLTLNHDKCVFGVTEISLLGHIIANGTKKPNPDRLKALLDLPTPVTTVQLSRMIGFFAYYAKWIADYSNKIRPLLVAQHGKKFPLDLEVINQIKELKTAIANATLTIPDPHAGQLILETDASGTAIGATLSQADRPIAFFSRTLTPSERTQSTVEREAMAIVEATRKWKEYLYSFPTLIKTDQKAISFIFSRQKSRIKNDKLARWRLELSVLNYGIIYRKGSENASADALSRSAASSTNATASPQEQLRTLHDALCHPGSTRLWDYVQRHNLPFSLPEVRDITSGCPTCRECKPKFFRPQEDGHVIRATRPFERLNIDIVGPKVPAHRTGRRFLLVVLDEFTRFPFAFALSEITTAAVLSCLREIFSLFGTSHFIHSDRGSQFLSADFDQQLLQWGIAHSRTTPYHPQGNGQVERYNGVLWKAIQCVLHSRQLQPSLWETVLPEALASLRSLLCTATGSSPHSLLFTFPRRGTQGFSLPGWLSAGKQAYMKNFARCKDDPLVRPVRILQVINPFFARVEQQSGRIDTISTRDLSPGIDMPQQTSTDETGEGNQTMAPSEPKESRVHAQDVVGDVDTGEDINLGLGLTEQAANTPVLDRAVRSRKPPERLQIAW